MISSFDYNLDRPELKPIIDCLDILTGLCGIIPVETAMNLMHEQFEPNATVDQVLALANEERGFFFEPDFSIWAHSGVEYITRGSLAAESCKVAEFYRSKHQIYTYDEAIGDYVGDYGPPDYERTERERITYLEHLAAAHKGIDPPTDLSEYRGKDVEGALFERPVSQKLHKVARAKQRGKVPSYAAEQAVRRNIRHIVGCDGTADVWVPLFVDDIVARTPLKAREKLDIPEIERLTHEMFLTFPKWENNGWSDQERKG